MDSVLAELEGKLSTQPDYITLSGSGEPTLFSRIGELIQRIKAMTQTPVAVLTNGSLLWQEPVRSELMGADLLIPSLDAGDESVFHAVNRPHKSIPFQKMLEGLIECRGEFQGQFWLEVLVLGGYTGVDAEMAKISECVGLIRPDWVQLNTVTRPPAEDFAEPVSSERLSQLSSAFDVPVEVIADCKHAYEPTDFSAGRNEIFAMLRRRPCSLEDIADGLGMHRNEVVKYVEELAVRGLVETSRTGGKLYYRGKRQEPSTSPP